MKRFFTLIFALSLTLVSFASNPSHAESADAPVSAVEFISSLNFMSADYGLTGIVDGDISCFIKPDTGNLNYYFQVSMSPIGDELSDDSIASFIIECDPETQNIISMYSSIKTTNDNYVNDYIIICIAGFYKTSSLEYISNVFSESSNNRVDNYSISFTNNDYVMRYFVPQEGNYSITIENAST